MLTCPFCDHDASTHAHLVGCSRDDCHCERTAASLYAAECERLRAALEQIGYASGPYSRDRLTHAENTINAMIDIARAALTAPEGK